MAAAPLLDVTGLDVSLGRLPRVPVLHGVNAEVRRGEIVGLIGETGSGKTTLARTVLGLVEPDAGEIRFDGVDIAHQGRAARRQFRREGAMQYIFQDPLRSLDPDRTSFESIAEGLVIRGDDSRSVATAVSEALRTVGLDDGVLDSYPAQISGGQRQRVAIARALALEPKLLICDEPVSALDATNRIRILTLLLELRETTDVGILLITHDLGTLGGLADRIVVLYRGHVVESGTTLEILLNPQHAYTRLLVSSIPTINGPTVSASERQQLRDDVAALSL